MGLADGLITHTGMRRASECAACDVMAELAATIFLYSMLLWRC